MSLHGSYDPNNVFARIIRGEMAAAEVHQDDRTLTFMDVFPQSRGHCLVIPKAPVRTLLEIEETDLAALILQTRRTALAVEAALKPEGITVMQFNGAAGGQSVFHLHFHVIPRWSGEALKAHRSGSMADMGELQALAERIRAAL